MAEKKEAEEIGTRISSIFPSSTPTNPAIPRCQQNEMHELTSCCLDYTLNNPDTLTKYKSAAQISQKVLADVTALCAAGEKIVTICERGDRILDEEIAKVYRGKKISKGWYC